MKYTLINFQDGRGNKIDCGKNPDPKVEVIFRGSNNTLIVHPEAKISTTSIHFDCDDGICIIGRNSFIGFIRIGNGCNVKINDGVTCTAKCYISTAEGSSVEIGDDCMFATGNEIRSDDGHPIFDVKTGLRINNPSSIKIGNHVWISAKATILGGTIIGDGSIVGLGSITKDVFPNNCIIVGVPAKVTKKDVAWERPHLTLSKPFIKKDSSSIKKSNYWNLTK
ncbi:acyltransferase [Rahnella sp. NRRL B-41462]|uniref:acyltransferase n=1 Tax=Rahnella sp. NRRL B-41462 TaxID=1610579 RepID=UPI000DD41367|nr:acyltransferase [Rahnella sp. NRRL B-41462]